jgi:heparan-alpha-glucosaminide N-acetyltransferase
VTIFQQGAGTALSLKSQFAKNVSRVKIFLGALRRAILLFLMGIVLVNGLVQSDQPQIMGVLQRFSLCGLFVTVVVLCCRRQVATVPSAATSSRTTSIDRPTRSQPPSPRGSGSSGSNTSIPSPARASLVAQSPRPGSVGGAEGAEGGLFRDLIPWEWVSVLFFIVAHTLCTFCLPVPGCPTGYLGPGGVGDFGHYPLCTGGAANFIDRTVLGPGRIMSGPTCSGPYNCQNHDPEGLLGTLTSCVLTYLGLVCGRIMIVYKSPLERLWRLVGWGCILGGAALLLCNGQQEGGVIPINKNLWSLSFIFATGATAFLMLALCYVLVDVTQAWGGAPFVYPGMNSILMYCLSELLQLHWPFSVLPAPNVLHDSHARLLISNLFAVFLYFCISYYLFKQEVFMKI